MARRADPDRVPVVDRSLAALPLLALVSVVVVGVLFPLTNTDIWWHLAAGRLIADSGQLLRVDPFSAGAAGAPWIDVHWLFQVAAHGAHRLAGVLGVVLLKCALAGLAAAVLHGAALVAMGHDATPQHRGQRLARGLCAAALIGVPVYLARYLVLARPIVVTLLCLSLYLLLLERYRRDRRPRLLLWLLPVQVLWANSQGLFLLGPALVGCYLAGDAAAALLSRLGFVGFDAPLARRDLLRLAAALVAVAAASLLTPYGVDGLLLPFSLLGRIDPTASDLFSYNISENVPPWLLERYHRDLVWHFKWVAAAAWASFLVAHRRIALARFCLLAAMFVLALMAHRNVLLFAWVAGPVVAANLALVARPRVWRRPAWLVRAGVALPALALAALLGHRLTVGRQPGPLDRPAPFRVPERAVELLARIGVGGDLFNSVRYGGYLAWALHPRYRPFIDGRLVIRSAAHFAEHLRVVDRPAAFHAFARRHRLRLALLPTALPERYLDLVVELCRHPDWRLLYTDGTEVLLAHRELWSRPALRSRLPGVVDLGSATTVRRIADELGQRYRGRAAAHARAVAHLGLLLAEVSELQRATEVLSSTLAPGRKATAADAHFGRSVLARVHYLAGRTRQARTLSHELLERDASDVNSLVLLALIDADDRRYRQAMGWARRALEIDPHNVQARTVLARIEREAGR